MERKRKKEEQKVWRGEGGKRLEERKHKGRNGKVENTTMGK